MRIEPVSRYRVSRPLPRQVETARTWAAENNVRSQYRRKLTKRRFWYAPRMRSPLASNSVGLSNIDHSPYELSINSFELDDTDELIINKNWRNKTYKKYLAMLRYEKYQKQGRGRIKGKYRSMGSE